MTVGSSTSGRPTQTAHPATRPDRRSSETGPRPANASDAPERRRPQPASRVTTTVTRVVTYPLGHALVTVPPTRPDLMTARGETTHRPRPTGHPPLDVPITSTTRAAYHPARPALMPDEPGASGLPGTLTRWSRRSTSRSTASSAQTWRGPSEPRWRGLRKPPWCSKPTAPDPEMLAIRSGNDPDMPLNRICPGCKRMVPILPPRPLANSSAERLGWRRRHHSTNRHDLSSPLSVRCRYPRTLAPEECPREEGSHP